MRYANFNPCHSIRFSLGFAALTPTYAGYVFRQAAGIRLDGSAADIARRGRPVALKNLHPGDLVFFNTRNAPFSHVGVYIGDDRFIHAPSSNGRVRIDKISARYYAQRFSAARAYFD
jgi:cell wall-associated NlpC family hydrolase